MDKVENDVIVPVNITEEMKKSYLDYAMSVIVSRAIPDVCDGLKPVHRRILFCMRESGYEYNKPFKKSARIVGEVIGKYHPHGDRAVYDAMVRMAQDFSMELPLIDGQGNFGSMDGDPAAAMRYTEARLKKVAGKILDDLDSDTVNFIPNYDESLLEPVVLPAQFPNLLVNGSGGIAVGMATNIPPHNMSEVIDACCYYINHRSLTFDELIQIMPGPDFPTGGIIVGRSGIRQYFKTGRGMITVRGKAEIEQNNNRSAIVIREIPYQVNKAKLVERIAQLAHEKVIENITAVRDESDRDGVRVVVEVRKDFQPEIVLNQLYKETPLQTTFGVTMLALNSGMPELFGVAEVIKTFISFRRDVVVRRSKFELAGARERVHVLTGLMVAVLNIDRVIQIIRQSADSKEAKANLLAIDWDASEVVPYIKLVDVQTISDGHFRFSDKQAQAILDLKLNRLTGLERDKLTGEIDALAKRVAELIEILNSEQKILSVIEGELLAIKAEFATKRKTEIINESGAFEEQDFIESEETVITVTNCGYIKRVPLNSYKSQKRGGRGKLGITTKDTDFVKNVFVANTHDSLLFFTSKGLAYKTQVYKLPTGSLTSKGKAIINLLSVDNDEKISAILKLAVDAGESLWEQNIIFATSKGSIRRNKLKDFVNIQSNGKRAIKLESYEKLIGVAICDDDSDVVLATHLGKCVRFHVSDLRVFASHNSSGVRGIKLMGDDHVISLDVVTKNHFSVEEREEYIRYSNWLRKSDDQDEKPPLTALTLERFQEMREAEQFLLSVTENGYGKRTSAYEYRTTSRGGLGVKNIEIGGKNGNVVAVFRVPDGDADVMITTNTGQLIRFPVDDIRITGRATQGVIIFRISDGEKVTSAAPIESSGEDVLASSESGDVVDVEVATSSCDDADTGIAGDGSDTELDNN